MVFNNQSFYNEENKEEDGWPLLYRYFLKFQGAFFICPNDKRKILEMAKDPNANKYVHIIIFQSLWLHDSASDPQEIHVHPRHMKIISSCSFHFCKYGANIDRIMTNPFQLESLERLSPKDTYRNKVTGHGFGNFF